MEAEEIRFRRNTKFFIHNKCHENEMLLFVMEEIV